MPIHLPPGRFFNSYGNQESPSGFFCIWVMVIRSSCVSHSHEFYFRISIIAPEETGPMALAVVPESLPLLESYES